MKKIISIQFIKSYESNLAVEGKEICKIGDSIGAVNNKLLVEIAVLYCHFISIQKDVDPKLVERCDNYIIEVNNFNSYKFNFGKLSNDREDRKKIKDRIHMRLKEI